MSKYIEPKNGYIILKPIEEQEVLAGNIILPDLGKERPEQQGKHLSEETKQKISQNSKGKTRKSGKPTPVTQYRYEIIKIPIATYPSIQEAAKTTGLNHSDISAVCLKKQITAGGFYWEKQK